MYGAIGSVGLPQSRYWATIAKTSGALVQSGDRIGRDFAEVAMRDISRAVACCWSVTALVIGAESSRQLPTSDQNLFSSLRRFGYQKRGTILDWGFSALVRYNGKTSLVWFIPRPVLDGSLGVGE